ncbi:MAG: hypothetical protein V4537_16010 [Pseudomonadota bacterium]
MNDFSLAHIIEAIAGFAAPLAPSVIGATIASLIKRGLTWTDRVLQIFIGSCASWYTLHAVAAIWPMDPRLEQAIAFTAGLISAEALPRVRQKIIDRVLDLPDMLIDLLLRLRKGGK